MEYRLIEISTKKFIFNNKVKANSEYEIKPVFGRLIRRINDTCYELLLNFSLHDSELKVAPYDIELEVSGLFQITGDNENDINDFMNINAVSIVFPYLRAILSTVMTSMQVAPIVLPIIDARNIFNNN